MMASFNSIGIRQYNSYKSVHICYDNLVADELAQGGFIKD